MKKLFCFIFLFVVNIILQNTVIAAENLAQKIQTFTQKQTKEIQKIIHDYVVNNPQLLLETGRKLQQIEEEKEKEQIKKIKSSIPKYKNQIFDTKAPGRVVLGNPQGKTVVAEFTQYQCAHCKFAAPLINNLLKNNPEIQLIVIYWPFIGNDASYAAKAVLAAQKQNRFEELNNALLAEESTITKDKIDTVIKSILAIDSKKLYADMNSKEIEDGLKDNFKLARNLNIIGTPTLIFANKEMTKFSFIPGKGSHFEDDLTKSLNEVR